MAYTGVILEGKANKILLQLRDNKPEIPYPGHWSIFGGEIEEGETPLEGAVREIEEELGKRLEKESLLFYKKVTLDKNYYIFRANFPYDLSEITLMEGQEARFFSRDETIKLDNLIPLVKEFIERYWQERIS